MKVLIIDNTLDPDSWGCSNLRKYVIRSNDRTAFVRRAPNEDLPTTIRGYDRVILSGSRTSCLDQTEWTSKLDALVREALDTNRPVLGVCYGHQTLNRVLGGRQLLRKAPKSEFGWTEIEVVERAPLFEGLPDKFWTFSSHYEEVIELPKGMRLLARSADCGIQACRLEDLPVYGIQFHPEKSLEESKRSIASWKKDERRSQIRFPEQSEKKYDEKVGDRIFENFLLENKA